MPLVSLLDLEKSLKLNHLLNNSNNNSTNGVNNSNNTNTNGLFYSNLSNELLKNLVANNKPLANLAFANQNQQSTNTSTSVAAAAAAALLNAGNLALSLNLANSNSNDNNANNQANNVNKQINYSRYKTELCRQFSENGECKYGDKCQFAHGFNDLKDINRHPKYKTELCKTFHSKGFCPYGPRCHFIHEINEKLDNLPCALKNEKSNTNSSSNELSVINEANVNALKQLKLNSNGYDKKLDEIQSHLASTLFSTDELFEDHLRLQQSIANTEGNQLSPVVSTDSSSSSTSHRSSSSSLSHLSLTSPKFNDLNKVGFLNQAQQMSLNETLNEQAAKLLLCNSIVTAAAIQQYQQDKDDVFGTFNGLSPETSLPSSPAPVRTRSNTSSTSSTFSSGSSTTSFNWMRQTPLRQQQPQSNNMLSNGGNIFDFMPSAIEQLTNGHHNQHHNQITPEKLLLINSAKQRQSASDFLQLNSEKIESNKILSNHQIIW
jgi:hypothetical protein